MPDTSSAGTLRELKSVPADAMAVDAEESSAMDLDDENGRPKNRFLLGTTIFFSFTFLILCNDIHVILISALLLSLNDGSQSNGGNTSDVYNIGEKEQWCLTTLGYVKAFSRQYASEVNIVI